MLLIADNLQMTQPPLEKALKEGNPEAMAAGAGVCRNPLIINGFSLEPVKLEKILPLAVEHDADIVGYLLTPQGHVPVLLEERLAIATDLSQTASAAGLAKERLIIDPVVAPVVWENGLKQNRELLSILRTLPDVLGFPVRTMAGLSNLTTGHIDRKQSIRLEQAIVPMLAEAGLTMLMLNIFHRESVQMAQICRLLLGDDIFSWASLP